MKIKQAYDKWATSYDADRNLTRDLDAIVIKKALRGLRPRSALELGCGTGKNTGYLGRISDSVLALDFSEGMIAQARSKVHAIHVVFRLADLTKPWPSVSLRTDLAVCNLVLEHIKDLDFVFSEARRTLRFGGMFFVSELHPFRQYQGKQANFQSERGAVRVPAYAHNISDFMSAADKAGFSLVKLDEWWHTKDEGKLPRLVSFLFRKPLRPNHRIERPAAR